MSNTINAILGPSYSYPTNIKPMKDMGFDAANNTSQLIENVNGSLEYVKQLAMGPELGNNFFLKSGKCSTGTSTVEKCRGKDRYLFVRNIPTGNIPCIGDPGISLDGGVGARGIIPGIMEDAIDINPIEISKAMLGISKKFGPDCVEKTYDKVKTPFHYLMDKVSLLSFSPFRKCEITQSEKEKLENKESN